MNRLNVSMRFKHLQTASLKLVMLTAMQNIKFFLAMHFLCRKSLASFKLSAVVIVSISGGVKLIYLT